MASKHPVWMSSGSKFQEWLTDSSELKQPAVEIDTVAELAYMLQCMTISNLQLQTAAAGTRNPFASYVYNERGIKCNDSCVHMQTNISQSASKAVIPTTWIPTCPPLMAQSRMVLQYRRRSISDEPTLFGSSHHGNCSCGR